MHDPLVVAFEIRRPWPQHTSRLVARKPGDPRWKVTVHGRGWRRFLRLDNWSPFATIAGREFYWPALITIWHREPKGLDSGEVCKHRRERRDGTRVISRRWRWHVHHWHVQVHPTQKLKRWLWSRCAECGRRFPYGYSVVSHQWDSDGPRWFRGESGKYHHECSSLVSLRRGRDSDELLIRWLFEQLRSETNETEIEALERLTDPKATDRPAFHITHRLVGLYPYERDDDYRLVKKAARR